MIFEDEFDRQNKLFLKKLELMDDSPYLYDHIVALCKHLAAGEKCGLWNEDNFKHMTIIRAGMIHDAIMGLDFSDMQMHEVKGS